MSRVINRSKGGKRKRSRPQPKSRPVEPKIEPVATDDNLKIISVVAVYKRPGITKKTIELMQKQTHPLDRIVIVGSDRIDGVVAEKTGCDFVQHKNMPLSNKWQYGIDYARQFEPDAILINGSDSWLTPNWCERTEGFIKEGFDLIGKTQFYSCKVNPKQKLQIVHRTYKRRKDPVGAGRLISKRTLDKLDWKWFPPGKRFGLDGTSFANMKRKIRSPRVKYINDLEDVMVMGIKSTTWDTINPFRFVMKDPQFTKAGEVEYPKDFVAKHFPDSLETFKELVPGVIL